MRESLWSVARAGHGPYLACVLIATLEVTGRTADTGSTGWETPAAGASAVLPAGTAVAPVPTSGSALLAECLNRLPLEPVTLSGWLSMRRQRGIVTKEFDFKVELNWGGTPPQARYTVSERGGAVLEQVIARRSGSLELVRLLGPAQEPAPAPEWNDRIQGSDVTWLDVSLGFLWWNSPRLVGEETVKGRLCDIVEVVPPAPVPNCAKVRLWLDRELKLLMQAEEIDPAGGVTRRMWVRAVKKTGDRWMVRDIEVETLGGGHRTRMHVSDVAGSDAP